MHLTPILTTWNLSPPMLLLELKSINRHQRHSRYSLNLPKQSAQVKVFMTGKTLIHQRNNVGCSSLLFKLKILVCLKYIEGRRSSRNASRNKSIQTNSKFEGIANAVGKAKG
ncbi:hypothetical protein LWI29_007340 [Acer saccharum]|uniref:Uncharacterized protein n=1 Tax=Acer saccharum TaxID=4024 RepID=A0AA39T834_ACESA|nr:hypothetical protein LWI29_007340 [Acer saccharum]